MGDVPGRRGYPPPFFSVPVHQYGDFGYHPAGYGGVGLHATADWLGACGVDFAGRGRCDVWMSDGTRFRYVPARLCRSAGACLLDAVATFGDRTARAVERVVPIGLCAPILYSEVYPVAVLVNCLVAWDGRGPD